ncbi:MAG: DUF3604 domain-containing protein [Candidatus Binatia bacterium]|nr:DUF3604 domain-containing protein [Candidatus Binatia bacterium]
MDAIRWARSGVMVAVSVFALSDAGAADRAFERTEDRAPCANYSATKSPFFGETHIHTAYSFDAVTLWTRNTPADGYRYAKGYEVGLAPWVDTRDQFQPTPVPPDASPLVAPYPYCLPPEKCQFTASRTAQLPEGRALDWVAITDHSEQFGESNICMFEPEVSCESDADCPAGQECGTVVGDVIADLTGGDLPTKCVPVGHGSTLCTLARDELTRLTSGPAAALVANPENASENPQRVKFCTLGEGPLGDRCIEQATNVWQQIQADAEAAYDRTSACTFTSFVAYEYTAMMSAGRCENLPDLPCWDNLGKDDASEDCPPEGGPKGLCVSTYPGSGGLDNMHRNIIFRNDEVLDVPISNIEAPVGCGKGDECVRPGSFALGSPQQMLEDLRRLCNDSPLRPRCEALSIPHNSNLSGGAMFLMPESLDEAEIRGAMEPLVEILQIKGSSECRFQADMPGAWGSTDEECAFEAQNFSRLSGEWLQPENRDPDNIPPNGFVRNTLKNGIQFDDATGINPFKLGFVGGLDNHNGTPGHSEEVDYARHGAHGVQSFAVSSQALDEKFFLGLETNGGGLTVAWAEENSRDSIFTALKNRETYATSGTRPIVRFFGGADLPPDICERGDFAAQGYAAGVPMGGTLTRSDVVGDAAPRFAVSAMMDPGWPLHPGTKLDRLQIVKGWVDGDETREQVFDLTTYADGSPRAISRGDGRLRVAPAVGEVDLATCRTNGVGAASLCSVWADPDFHPDSHAFYYVRVLEQPSCRWNQYYCNARGVDCAAPQGVCGSTDPSFNGKGCASKDDCGGGVCETPMSYTAYEYQQCCAGAVPKTVQQRAWTSPIWYSPVGAGSAP